MIFMTIYIDWFDLEVSLDNLLDTVFSLFIAKLTWTCLRIYPDWWIAILLLIFLLESNIPLTTYEDFLELSVKQLTDYLSVRGLNTSGRKVELIARAFAAMELKLDIIQSSESQSNLL